MSPAPLKSPRLAVDPNTGCWLWLHGTNSVGYGQLRVAGRAQYVHRLVYEALVGPIPDGLELDHTCETPLCANPAHLEPVSHAENMRRIQSRRATCKRGHAWTTDNTYIRPDTGERQCRECVRMRRHSDWRAAA